MEEARCLKVKVFRLYTFPLFTIIFARTVPWGEFYLALFQIRSSISAPEQTSQHTDTPCTVLTSQNAAQTAHILSSALEVVNQSLSHRLKADSHIACRAHAMPCR